MVRHRLPATTGERPLVATSMFGVTTPCVQSAQKMLDAAGFEVLVFHATGTGGLTLESFARDRLLAGVLDITTTELADELVGGILTAGRDRLTAAAIVGIPQVISLGALDMVNFGPKETVPAKFANRLFHEHNANVTLMRTTPEENDRLGKEIAEKASAARGPTTILVPLRGVSALDRDGGPFWWPDADAALFASLRNWISPTVKVIEVDRHINDPEFAELAAATLLEMIKVERSECCRNLGILTRRGDSLEARGSCAHDTPRTKRPLRLSPTPSGVLHNARASIVTSVDPGVSHRTPRPLRRAARRAQLRRRKEPMMLVLVAGRTRHSISGRRAHGSNAAYRLAMGTPGRRSAGGPKRDEAFFKVHHRSANACVAFSPISRWT